MGMFVIDLGNESNSLPVNYWNWHPTVELIERMGLVDKDRIALMHMPFTGVRVTESEARAIGAKFRTEILPSIPETGRVLHDGSVTTEPDDGTMHYGDEAHKNYSATRSWLTKFADFCDRCGGFKVI